MLFLNRNEVKLLTYIVVGNKKKAFHLRRTRVVFTQTYYANVIDICPNLVNMTNICEKIVNVRSIYLKCLASSCSNFKWAMHVLKLLKINWHWLKFLKCDRRLLKLLKYNRNLLKLLKCGRDLLKLLKWKFDEHLLQIGRSLWPATLLKSRHIFKVFYFFY